MLNTDITKDKMKITRKAIDYDYELTRENFSPEELQLVLVTGLGSLLLSLESQSLINGNRVGTNCFMGE
jgi:hypothetical protein